MSSISRTVRIATEKPEVSLLYLYLLRGAYLLLAIGLGSTVWPTIVHHGTWTLWQGVGKSFLGAISLLAFLGLRYPVKMLPLLFFEITWKAIWLLAVPLPMALAHTPIDADTAETLQECTLAVVFLFAIPWRYVVTTFVLARGDRWR
ncbi:MAG: hypothetical protein JO322_08820 [Candidatus Eremiobacteraeota bacterium]|nr:hypothetical protein [Candidatus Eremiobacteraeota bacterium]